MALFPRIIDLMKEQEIFGEHLLLGGGVIPDEDVEELKQLGVDEIMGQDTPPDAIVDLVRTMVAERGCAVVECWSFPPRYDDAYTPPPDQPYWFPERETMDPAERDELILGRLREVCAYALERSPFYRAQVGRLPTRDDLESLRGLRAPAGDHQGRAARRPGRAPAVRLLHLHRARGRRARARHQRHHGPPDRVRHRPRRLARDRQRARPDHVGDGHPPVRHRLHRVGLQPLHGLVGDAVRRRAPRRRRVPVRRRRGRAEPARRQLDGADEARRLLRHALLRAAAGRDRRRGGPRPARLRDPDPVLLRRAGRVDPEHPRPDRGALRRQGLRLRLDGGDDAVDEPRRVQRPRPGCCAGRTSSTPRSATPRPTGGCRSARRARPSTRTSSAPASR